MNWKNRASVRFILLVGSLLVMAALLTLIIKYLTASGRPKNLPSVDMAIQAWDGYDEPKAILQDLSDFSNDASNSGAALSLLKRYRFLAVRARTKTIQWELVDQYAHRAVQFYEKFPERAEILLLFLDSLNLVSRPLSESEKNLLKKISLRSISAQNAGLLMLVLQKARMNTPAYFKVLPYGTALLQELIHIDEHKMDLFAVNQVLTLALAGNFQAALGAGKGLSATNRAAKNMVAYLFYDFGAPEEAARLFQEFVRIKNEKTKEITGTGLGLSIVKKIVTTYAGTITVESTPDIGSRFIVKIPYKSEKLN